MPHLTYRGEVVLYPLQRLPEIGAEPLCGTRFGCRGRAFEWAILKPNGAWPDGGFLFQYPDGSCEFWRSGDFPPASTRELANRWCGRQSDVTPFVTFAPAR